ncbi:MAG: hypothetical protein RLZZ479_1252, partial [Bacteroidota bacterium]
EDREERHHEPKKVEIIEESKPPKSPKMKYTKDNDVFIMILSSHKNFGRRARQRSTWLRELPQHYSYKFILGNPHSIEWESESQRKEFEKEVDAIVGEFGVQTEALLDIVSGKTEPSGLLPLQMPIDMTTVEKQFEDVPHDMIPYRDSNGNVYDFGFGLNWKGIIKDARTEKYNVKK